MPITQFRLSNGDALIAEVVQEPEADEINLIIRNAMQIITTDANPSVRYYSFRPWMVYQNDPNYFQLLNFKHIVGEAKPDSLMEEQYKKAMEIERNANRITKSDVDSKYKELMKYLDSAEYIMEDIDSDYSNVIHFQFDKDKLH